MRKFFGAAVAALALAAIPVLTHAQGASAAKPPATTQKAAAPKATTAAGEVTDVAPDSLSVKGKTDSWKFVIDAKTSVTAKGATHKTLALKSDGKSPVLTDFVKKGNSVSVTYHEANGAKHADAIRVTSAPAK
jgi:hypothetical protein